MMWRNKHRKYSNVLVSKNFVPLVGDTAKEIKMFRENKAHYAHYAENAAETNKYDLMAKIEGSLEVVLILSSKAVGEFVKHQRAGLIDKFHTHKGLQVMFNHSYSPESTSKAVAQRR